MNDKTKILGEMSIGKLLLKMSLPATIGMLVMTLYNIVDAVFIGYFVGSLGLAAVSIVFPGMMMIIALSVGFGVGASSLISLNFGRKDFKKANKIFNNFIFLISVLSIFLSISCYIFIDQILIFLGSSESILPFAKSYFSVIILGFFFQMFTASINNIIRAEGASKTAMFTMIIGAVLNIVLDYLFMVVFNFGIEGIAYATIIAQFFQFLFTSYYFLFGQSVLKITLKYLIPKFSIIKEILTLGFPSFIRQFSMSIVGILMNNLLNIYGGDLEIAAYGIIFRVMMITIMPAMGILQGTQPIIGFNYGAKKINRVKDVLKLAIKSATIIITLFYLVIMFFPDLFIQIFTQDSNLIEITNKFIPIIFLLLPVIGFQFIVGGYFQAIGNSRLALFTSLLRQIIFLVPLLLILPVYFGVIGIWYAYPISDFFSTIILFFVFRREYKSM